MASDTPEKENEQQSDDTSEEIRRHRKRLWMRWGIVVATELILALSLSFLLRNVVFQESRDIVTGQEQVLEGEEFVTEEETDPSELIFQSLAEAELLAQMYDYDGAVQLLQDSEFYEKSSEMQSAVADYEAQKDACISWAPENVTHIFYHTIIMDPSKAFDGEGDQDGFNQYMVTMDEFSKITRTMYDEGYVMVSMHDMCTVNEDGSMSEKEILLPEGKIPFVLSQDDVSYYHYMDGDGFAQKLIVTDDGKVKNTYIEDDGTVSVGDYDLVPWIDTFVEEHPDFSYHGHKGIIALTGYEGVLGYRTDEVYRTRDEDRMTEWQVGFFNENPDFDEAAWQKEVDDATAVATAMKEEGWEFASHTWGHIDPLAKGLEKTKTDTERWLDNVAPIVGDTDVIIFAFGADIGNWEPYDDSNDFYVYLKEKGFDIFCNVDSSTYWVEFNGESMRMARRNIDGYRMYYFPELLTDLFNVSDVWDDSRPVPVPKI